MHCLLTNRQRPSVHFCERAPPSRPCRYFTMLRHPIDRLLSVHAFHCVSCGGAGRQCGEDADPRLACPNMSLARKPATQVRASGGRRHHSCVRVGRLRRVRRRRLHADLCAKGRPPARGPVGRPLAPLAERQECGGRGGPLSHPWPQSARPVDVTQPSPAPAAGGCVLAVHLCDAGRGAASTRLALPALSPPRPLAPLPPRLPGLLLYVPRSPSSSALPPPSPTEVDLAAERPFARLGEAGPRFSCGVRRWQLWLSPNLRRVARRPVAGGAKGTAVGGDRQHRRQHQQAPWGLAGGRGCGRETHPAERPRALGEVGETAQRGVGIACW